MPGIIHQIEVSVPKEKLPRFIAAMEDLGLTFRDTGFIRVTDLDAFITRKQASIEDDFHPLSDVLLEGK